MLTARNGCQIRDLLVVFIKVKTNCCSVSQIKGQEELIYANGIAFVVSCKTQNSSYRGKFDQGKRTFELAGIRVIREKSKGNGTVFELAGSSSSEFDRIPTE